MAKQKVSNATAKNVLAGIVTFLVWLTGVIVSLAVGNALIEEVLEVPALGAVNIFAGWVVVILTILGVVLKIIEALK